LQYPDLPPVRRGNGRLLCPTCGEALVYQKTRERTLIYTAEEGPTYSSVEVVVGRCPKEGRYRTALPSELVKNKHYSNHEIQMVLEGGEDYCLACERIKAYWRFWFKGVWKTVINKLHKVLRNRISKETIERSLFTFLKTEIKEWLNYVLTLFYSDADNLCTLFDLTTTTIPQRGNIMSGCSEHRGIQPKHHAPGG